jgi:uncharacterized protein involved in tolerance to divalent cations
MIVFVTAPTRAEANRLAGRLVRERLAACVSVVPSIRSTYWWKGRVERADECLLVIKTLSRQFGRLSRRIHALHSYTVPEVLALPVVRGSAPYLAWMRQSLKPQ